MTEIQNWYQDKGHIQRKGHRKSFGFKPPMTGASAIAVSAHDISWDPQILTVWRPASTLTHIHIAIYCQHYQFYCSDQDSSVDKQVIDQFFHMKSILTSFLRPRQETTLTAHCNYLASEVENMQERDFLTIQN